MARYVYTGWGPETAPDGEIVRPLDEREFAEQPTWGRWALVGDPEPSASVQASAPPEASASVQASALPPLTVPKGM